MAYKRGKRHAFMFLLALAAIGAAMVLMTRGSSISLFQTKGSVADQERDVMLFAVGIMVAAAVPVLSMIYWFAWKYRETNRKTASKLNDSKRSVHAAYLWLVPLVLVAVIAARMLPATRNLDPNKPISGAKPVMIQVVALRWKWLFIYPEQDIATVNFVQFPIDTPVVFELTADEAPMSSFWIPQLGGQLYAMTGHVNRLNLIAREAGDYSGRTAEINGEGFSGMQFMARATRRNEFDSWSQNLRRSGEVLDEAGYQKLLIPSQQNPAAFYATDGFAFYDKVLAKYSREHAHMEHK